MRIIDVQQYIKELKCPGLEVINLKWTDIVLEGFYKVVDFNKCGPNLYNETAQIHVLLNIFAARKETSVESLQNQYIL